MKLLRLFFILFSFTLLASKNLLAAPNYNDEGIEPFSKLLDKLDKNEETEETRKQINKALKDDPSLLYRSMRHYSGGKEGVNTKDDAKMKKFTKVFQDTNLTIPPEAFSMTDSDKDNRGKEKDLSPSEKDKRSIGHYAIMSGNLELVEAIVKKGGDNVNSKTANAWGHGLFFSFVKEFNVEGSDADKKKKKDIAKALFERLKKEYNGRDDKLIKRLNKNNEYGSDLIHWLMRNGYEDIVKEVVDKGWVDKSHKANKVGSNRLVNALKNGHTGLADYYLDKVKLEDGKKKGELVTQTNDFGLSPLYIASNEKQEDFLKKALKTDGVKEKIAELKAKPDGKHHLGEILGKSCNAGIAQIWRDEGFDEVVDFFKGYERGPKEAYLPFIADRFAAYNFAAGKNKEKVDWKDKKHFPRGSAIATYLNDENDSSRENRGNKMVLHLAHGAMGGGDDDHKMTAESLENSLKNMMFLASKNLKNYSGKEGEKQVLAIPGVGSGEFAKNLTEINIGATDEEKNNNRKKYARLASIVHTLNSEHIDPKKQNFYFVGKESEDDLKTLRTALLDFVTNDNKDHDPVVKLFIDKLQGADDAAKKESAKTLLQKILRDGDDFNNGLALPVDNSIKADNIVLKPKKTTGDDINLFDKKTYQEEGDDEATRKKHPIPDVYVNAFNTQFQFTGASGVAAGAKEFLSKKDNNGVGDGLDQKFQGSWERVREHLQADNQKVYYDVGQVDEPEGETPSFLKSSYDFPKDEKERFIGFYHNKNRKEGAEGHDALGEVGYYPFTNFYSPDPDDDAKFAITEEITFPGKDAAVKYEFKTSEHYFQAMKFFEAANDESNKNKRDKLLECFERLAHKQGEAWQDSHKNPRDAFDLAGKEEGKTCFKDGAKFSKEKWDAHAHEHMYKALLLKFTQGQEDMGSGKSLQELLLETGDSPLVEYTDDRSFKPDGTRSDEFPPDRLWGYSRLSGDGLDEKKKGGYNHLGKMLMMVRHQIRENLGDPKNPQIPSQFHKDIQQMKEEAKKASRGEYPKDPPFKVTEGDFRDAIGVYNKEGTAFEGFPVDGVLEHSDYTKDPPADVDDKKKYAQRVLKRIAREPRGEGDDKDKLAGITDAAADLLAQKIHRVFDEKLTKDSRGAFFDEWKKTPGLQDFLKDGTGTIITKNDDADFSNFKNHFTKEKIEAILKGDHGRVFLRGVRHQEALKKLDEWVAE